MPSSASAKLAARNEFVTMVPFAKARHTKEWNVDPERWTAAVTEWLPDHLSRSDSTMGERSPVIMAARGSDNRSATSWPARRGRRCIFE